jgi:peptidyl-prolyl cis-trans isomerase C
MPTYKSITLPLAALLALGFAIASSAFAATNDKVVATVNGSNITESTLMRYEKHRRLPPNGNKLQQRQAMLNELINLELIYQDAKKIGIDKTDEYKSQVENAKKSIMANIMLQQHAETSAISDAELKKEYDKRKKDMVKTEYNARHILLKKEADAKAVIAELNKGADFAELAKKKSTGPSASQGGDLGWFTASEMVKPFADAVAKLKNGEYTKTPVHTKFGWHVILRENTREVEPPPFAAMKQQLRQRMQSKLVQDYIAGLHKDAKINIEK